MNACRHNKSTKLIFFTDTRVTTMVKALICGGGNGAHVMAGIAAAQTRYRG